MIEKELQFGSSTDELDLILLEQLQRVKKSKKVVKRHRKLLKNDPWLDAGDVMLDKKAEFLESMINDKTLLHKKHKKKKGKDPDILARNPVYDMYRQALYVTVFGYKMLSDSVSNYMSYFKKGKD